MLKGGPWCGAKLLLELSSLSLQTYYSSYHRLSIGVPRPTPPPFPGDSTSYFEPRWAFSYWSFQPFLLAHLCCSVSLWAAETISTSYLQWPHWTGCREVIFTILPVPYSSLCRLTLSHLALCLQEPLLILNLLSRDFDSWCRPWSF